ncbi:MAG: hypothetical protein ACK4VO_03810 [Pseudobdellovibrio sp.]
MKHVGIQGIHNSERSRVIEQSSLNIKLDTYHELQDQDVTEIDVLALIQQQFEQIRILNSKRSFLLKEISQYIVK